MKLALLSNVNMDMLARALKKNHQPYLPEGYGAWRQEAYAPEKIQAFQPDAVVIVLDGNALARETGESGLSAALREAAGCVGLLLKALPGAELIVSNMDLHPYEELETDRLPPWQEFSLEWERLLCELTQSSPRVHRFDLAGLIARIGRENFYSDKLWYLGSQPYDIRGMDALKTGLEAMLTMLRAPRRKLIAVDLDNTLWGGVIGEDGMEGVELGLSHTGAIYRDTQLALKRLREHGALLAVVSKNNPEDAMLMLERHPQMVLHRDDFAAQKINWDPKSQNLLALSKELSIGLDSFVFLDDNPAERGEVAQALPQVAVADFPEDISRLPAMVEVLGEKYFRSFRLTGEDVEKTAQYRAEARRSALLEGSASLTEYLLSLQITAQIGMMTPGQLERVSQLTNKTNQFNVLTRRMSLGEVNAYQESGGRVFTASSGDRYGDNGLVFVCMASRCGDEAEIDNLLMSCRVMGRHLEDALMREIERRLAQTGVKTLKAAYRETKKNAPVKDLFDRLGFAPTGQREGEKTYALQLEDLPSKGEGIIRVSWRD